ncbi:hypothetical protein KF7HA_02309 [Lactococcus lactis]|nr:hypothetical protein [Lactococcus lactis]
MKSLKEKELMRSKGSETLKKLSDKDEPWFHKDFHKKIKDLGKTKNEKTNKKLITTAVVAAGIFGSATFGAYAANAWSGHQNMVAVQQKHLYLETTLARPERTA